MFAKKESVSLISNAEGIQKLLGSETKRGNVSERRDGTVPLEAKTEGQVAGINEGSLTMSVKREGKDEWMLRSKADETVETRIDNDFRLVLPWSS